MNTTPQTNAARETGHIEELSRRAIACANRRGATKEAGQLGQLFGSWKRGHGVGDSMMSNAALNELEQHDTTEIEMTGKQALN